MSHIYKEALKQAWTCAWGHESTDPLEKLISPAYERISRRTGAHKSFTELKQELTTVRQAFPDMTTEVTGILADGDQIAVYWETTGTHSEELHGVPPTYKPVRTWGSNLLTLDEDGLIRKDIVTWDSTEILSALGVSALEDTPIVDTETTEDMLAGDAPPEVMKGFNRQFVTGATVVTTMDGEEPRGLAVNAYCSVSLDPALVLVCVQKSSSTYPALFSSTHLGINILSTQQRDVIGTFAKKMPNKFEHVDWHAAPSGSPLLDGSSASLEAEIRQRFQAKTHTIFICRVRHAEVGEDEPMIYKSGQFYNSEKLLEL